MIESTTLDALYLENSGCFDSIQIDGEYINIEIFEFYLFIFSLHGIGDTCIYFCL
jgi:hypothetical protein